MCKTKIQNEAGGTSLCSVVDCCHWMLSFIQTMVVRTLLIFSLHSVFFRWFCWSLDMISPALCIRSHVLMCHEFRRIKGLKRSLAGRALLILHRHCQYYRQGSRYQWGFSYRLNMCLSVCVPSSAGWHRKEAMPQTSDSCFSRWGKAGTGLSNPTQPWVFVQVFVCWLDTSFLSCCQQRCVNVVVGEK